MGTERWLLPEGIDEVLPPQTHTLERVRRDVLDIFYRWGYDLVIPPFIEYLDSLLTGTGSDLDLQTFKLTDQLSGRLMGVRADMTPQVARIDAHRLRRNEPVRLCYLGTVLRTRPDGADASRSPMQVGAELYGHSGADSDVEVICLMLEMLRCVGITQEIHIDLGHVGIFRGLARHAGLNTQQEAELFDALQRKARVEINELVAFVADAQAKDMLARLIDLNGGAEVLVQARTALRAAPRTVHDALDNLERIAGQLQRQGDTSTLYFDLAELRGYQYQTGVVFAAYVPGHGQEAARGGRYDDIGKVFGRARPATGFSADLKTLIALGNRAVAPVLGIFAPAIDNSALNAAVTRLRQSGERVVRGLPGQIGGAQAMSCDRVLKQQGKEWVVTIEGV
ncbi:MAG: ATP phosphoribosyltransferase regulatory subunit [Gammaproteobacteria bacterium]|nr:ATP phosphoribosyltransferase regulatory subunit [Gammaproteobacteria bacterium]